MASPSSQGKININVRLSKAVPSSDIVGGGEGGELLVPAAISAQLVISHACPGQANQA